MTTSTVFDPRDLNRGSLSDDRKLPHKKKITQSTRNSEQDMRARNWTVPKSYGPEVKLGDDRKYPM